MGDGILSGVDSPPGWIAVAALSVAVLALLLGWVNHRRYAVVRRRYEVLWGDGTADVSTLLARQIRRLEGQAERLDTVSARVDGLREDLRQSLQHVAVVRYDAFGDMGGRMSFSAAVVDDRGDGVVLSSIHARGESRTYAKGVLGGRSDVTLSPEERQALDAARSGRPD